MKKNIIEVNVDNVENYICKCGNTSSSDGFYPCDDFRKQVEPNAGTDWNYTYNCSRCNCVLKIVYEDEKNKI